MCVHCWPRTVTSEQLQLSLRASLASCHHNSEPCGKISSSTGFKDSCLIWPQHQAVKKWYLWRNCSRFYLNIAALKFSLYLRKIGKWHQIFIHTWLYNYSSIAMPDGFPNLLLAVKNTNHLFLWVLFRWRTIFKSLIVPRWMQGIKQSPNTLSVKTGHPSWGAARRHHSIKPAFMVEKGVSWHILFSGVHHHMSLWTGN